MGHKKKNLVYFLCYIYTKLWKEEITMIVEEKETRELHRRTMM